MKNDLLPACILIKALMININKLQVSVLVICLPAHTLPKNYQLFLFCSHIINNYWFVILFCEYQLIQYSHSTVHADYVELSH